MTRSRLPLRAIAVFETVARLGSFKAAAKQLHLTPSAVSHQIRALEDELGVELFTRVLRGVRLSAEAAEFAKSLHAPFEHIRRATDDIAAYGRKPGTAGVVRIMTPPSLANHWLMPRLPAFLQAHPGVDVRVFAVRTADSTAENVDIVIGYGDASRWSGRAEPLLQERTEPYCAPDRLGRRSSLTAEMLLQHPLIRSRDNDLSWDVWLGRRGLSLASAVTPPIQIDPSYVAIEAAVKGIGVILESSILTQDHVEAGRLVAPVREPSQASTSYWLLPLPKGAKPPAAAAYDWLLHQANV